MVQEIKEFSKSMWESVKKKHLIVCEVGYVKCEGGKKNETKIKHGLERERRCYENSVKSGEIINNKVRSFQS